jgi:hypothetical protein
LTARGAGRRRGGGQPGDGRGGEARGARAPGRTGWPRQDAAPAGATPAGATPPPASPARRPPSRPHPLRQRSVPRSNAPRPSHRRQRGPRPGPPAARCPAACPGPGKSFQGRFRIASRRRCAGRPPRSQAANHPAPRPHRPHPLLLLLAAQQSLLGLINHRGQGSAHVGRHGERPGRTGRPLAQQLIAGRPVGRGFVWGEELYVLLARGGREERPGGGNVAAATRPRVGRARAPPARRPLRCLPPTPRKC